jgi:hypothetical protein
LSRATADNSSISLIFGELLDGPPFALASCIMKRLIDAIIIFNTALVLAGVLVVRYDRAKAGAAQWTPPAPPAQVDPYKHLRARFHPAV